MSTKLENQAIACFFLLTGCLGSSVAAADDLADVTAANNAFYAALSARDPNALAKIYAHDNYVANISPGTGALHIGWPEVEKWAASLADAYKDLAVTPSDLHIHVNGTTAWLVNIEHAKGTFLKTNTAFESTLISTNIYEKREGGWLMVSHQTQIIPK
jgi:ketosteroid isomerase-like protein